jgi:hypothetical protein
MIATNKPKVRKFITIILMQIPANPKFNPWNEKKLKLSKKRFRKIPRSIR